MIVPERNPMPLPSNIKELTFEYVSSLEEVADVVVEQAVAACRMGERHLKFQLSSIPLSTVTSHVRYKMRCGYISDDSSRADEPGRQFMSLLHFRLMGADCQGCALFAQPTVVDGNQLVIYLTMSDISFP